MIARLDYRDRRRSIQERGTARQGDRRGYDAGEEGVRRAARASDPSSRSLLLDAADAHDRARRPAAQRGQGRPGVRASTAKRRASASARRAAGNGKVTDEKIALSTSHLKLGSVYQNRGESQPRSTSTASAQAARAAAREPARRRRRCRRACSRSRSSSPSSSARSATTTPRSRRTAHALPVIDGARPARRDEHRVAAPARRRARRPRLRAARHGQFKDGIDAARRGDRGPGRAARARSEERALQGRSVALVHARGRRRSSHSASTDGGATGTPRRSICASSSPTPIRRACPTGARSRSRTPSSGRPRRCSATPPARSTTRAGARTSPAARRRVAVAGRLQGRAIGQRDRARHACSR